MTEKVRAKTVKNPEGSEIPDLADFRDWGKKEGAGPEPEAAPPTMDEAPEGGGPRPEPTEETVQIVGDTVQKATFVMHHCYAAAVQIIAHETGADQNVINMDMQPSMPAALVHQMATPLAKAIFDGVYDDNLKENLNFVFVEQEKPKK